MKIRLLPTKIINQIAAGEVVERPASVVKELVENSLDAGATDIKLVIAQGGRNLIKVVDNGCGIVKSEMKLALERHATSKLTGEDILHIKHMGFRGEALPSIASVSRMQIISRTKDEDTGWCIKVEGGDIIKDLTPIASPVGTAIEIRDLFFATPTRLKFLKTEKAETQHIIEIVNKIAVAQPAIKFTLTVNDKQIFTYQACSDQLDRLVAVKGVDFQENTIKIDAKKEGMELSGYAGIPTYNRSNTSYLDLFVNNRPVRDNVLIAAVKAAYYDFIPQRKYPIVVLFLNLPFSLVDVNVHPTKAEVRFQDKSAVRIFIINELKLAIKRSLYQVNSEVSVDALKYIKKEESNHTQASMVDCLINKNEGCDNLISLADETLSVQGVQATSGKRQVAELSRLYENKLGDQNNISASKAKVILDEGNINVNSHTSITDKQTECITKLERPLGEACCQIYKTYILSVTEQDIFLIDQHAAHERLVYERLKSSVKNESQSLLMPEMVELNPAEVELMLGYLEDLKKLGMVIEKMGERAIIVRAIPSVIGTCDVKKLTLDLLDTISEFGITLSLEEKLKSIYSTVACHNSIRAGRVLNIVEMNSILRQMESTAHSGQCNHGRQTYIKLKKTDIEKLFDRR